MQAFNFLSIYLSIYTVPKATDTILSARCKPHMENV